MSKSKEDIPVELEREKNLFRAYSGVCLIALIGTVLSVIFFLLVLNQNMRTLERDFRHDAESQFVSLIHKINTWEQFWEDTQALYATLPTIEETAFEKFSSSILRHEDLSFISWIPNKKDGVTADDIYFVGKSREQEGEVKEFLLQEPLILGLIGQSRKENSVAVSEVFVFSFENNPDRQKHIAVVVPTISNGVLSGFIVSFLETGRFFTDVFQLNGENGNSQSIQVYLTSAKGGTGDLVFEHMSEIGPSLKVAKEVLEGYTPAFFIERKIPLGSRILDVTIAPSVSYLAQSVSMGLGPWLALGMGIILTTFLAILFYKQVQQRIETERLVDQRTRALASSEKHMRAIINNTVDGIITINDQGIVQTYNPACEKIFGYSSEEVIGQNVKMLMPEPYHSEHNSYISTYKKTGEAKIIGIGREVKGLRKDGTVFPMDLSIGEVTNNSRRMFVGIVRDVTERKEVARYRELLATIIESSDDAIVSKRLDGTITSWNTGAERMFGYSAEEAIGQHISLIIPSEYRYEEDEIVAHIKDGKHIEHFETVRKTKTGELRNVSITISPIKDSDGKTVGASKVIRDITERKKAETQLQEYTEQIKRSNQDLDDFVYIVSHDLKEPVRGLYSYAQFLQEDYEDKLDEAGLDKLQTLKKLSTRMEELIDTLLQYSRLGRTELAYKNTDLNEVVKKTLDLIEPIVDKKDITIEVHDKLPRISCDSARVGEIFRNLITNAIKYNDSKHKYIEVGCTTDHKEYPGQYVFYVADNGIGIQEKHRDVIFKMFKRLHGKEAYGGGTGSGLAIVKKIIDRHHGRIWVESNKDQGSIFYFTLQE